MHFLDNTGRNISNAFPIFTLLCHQDVAMGITCLSSLIRHCKDEFKLVIVDDGSLSEEDVGLINLNLHAEIIRRKQIEEVTSIYFKKKPKIMEWFHIHPMMIKILCIPIFANNRFGICDSDILFIRDFKGFCTPNINGNLYYMYSNKQSYSLRFSDLYFRYPKNQVVYKLNAGFMHVNKEIVDYDFIEFCLNRYALSFIRSKCFIDMTEQTLWALLAARTQSFYFDRKMISFPAASRNISFKNIALHFIRPFRHLLFDIVYRSRIQDHEDMKMLPLSLKVHPAIIDNLLSAFLRASLLKIKYKIFSL